MAGRIITPLPVPGPRVYTAEYPHPAIKVPHDFLRSTNLGSLTRAGGGLGAFASTSLFSPGREQWSNPNSPSPTTAQHVDTKAYTCFAMGWTFGRSVRGGDAPAAPRLPCSSKPAKWR
ncbi:hypothetical protein EV714DRAFT_278409 [Schizophyllum commune]